MTASLLVLKSPLDVYSRDVEYVAAGKTVDSIFSELSEQYTGPTEHVMCIVNGSKLETEQWKLYIVKSGDAIIVCPRVQGLSSLVIQLIIAVATTVLSYLLTDVPKVDKVGELPDASPTYDLQAQGNAARLGKVIPVRYGRFRVYPDFASSPYREYIGDDQFLYQLFSIGQGEFSYADLKIGDTPIDNYDEVEYEFYSPGQLVTLFNDAVNVSPDITNTTLFAPNEPEYTDWSGGFVANDVDTVVTQIAIDIVIPKGLYNQNDQGGLDARTVSVEFQYRAIDEFGLPDGVWTPLITKSYTAATIDPIRRTIKKTISVSSGRVEIRGRRTNNSDDSHRENDEVRWVGLKAYLSSDHTYEHSVWAVKAKATDNLSSKNERQFNLVATRKLPVWDGAQWLAIAPTRNLAWAFCDALKSEYGGDYSDGNIDLDEVKRLADVWDARGDYFDGQFDTKETLWNALKKICLAGRAVPYQYGELFTIIRDEPNSGDTYMFNGRNIQADSLSISYLTVDEFADDSVEVEYTDPQTWKTETISAAVPGSPANKPKQVKLFGVTDRTQAHREAMFMAARQEYRNVVADFKTELDGRVLDYLTQVIVVQDISKWGVGGEVVAVNGQVLSLSEPVEFEPTGSHYIYLRGDRGESYGPYEVVPTVDDQEVSLLDPVPEFLYTGDTKEKTYFAFVSPVSTPRNMLVENVSAAGEMSVSLKAVIDNPIVHTFDAMIDAGTIITLPPTSPKQVGIFAISNLIVIQAGTLTSPQLILSWSPAEDAKRNLIDVSYDVGETWSRAATVTVNSAIIDVRKGTVRLRIAPQNDDVGQWFERDVVVGSEFAIPAEPTGLALSSAFTGLKVDVDWDTSPTAVSWFVEVVDLGGDARYSESLTTANFTYTYAQASIQGIGREFDIHVYSVNANGVRSATPAILRVKNEQTAALSGVTAVGLIDQIVLTWNDPVEGDNAGVRVYASRTQGFTPQLSDLIDADVKTLIYSFPSEDQAPWYIRVAGEDVWGEDELNYSAEVSAQATKIVSTQIDDDQILTPHLAANSVTASKVTIASLSALSAVMGTVTSGIFKTSSLLGYRAEISSEGNYPIWYGTGTKDAANGKFYVDKNGNIVAKGIQIEDGLGNVILSSGGTYNGQIAAANVTGLAAMATIDQITAANISTYIEAAAIGTAQIGNAAITSAKIGNAAITNAKIGNAAVDTLTVAGRAITHPLMAYTSGTINVGTGGANVQAIAIAATGQPVSIDGCVTLDNSALGGTNTYTVSLKRGSSTLWSSTVKVPQGSSLTVSPVYIITTSGTQTFYLHVSGSFSTSNVSKRTLKIMEVKR